MSSEGKNRRDVFEKQYLGNVEFAKEGYFLHAASQLSGLEIEVRNWTYTRSDGVILRNAYQIHQA